MQHEAKIAYYAFGVIRFFVPYAARLKLRGRVARWTCCRHGFLFFSRDLGGWGAWSSI